VRSFEAAPKPLVPCSRRFALSANETEERLNTPMQNYPATCSANIPLKPSKIESLPENGIFFDFCDTVKPCRNLNIQGT
jgi:hypothetical protein